MTNSSNPNRGHYNPGPVITHPKTPASEKATDKPASTGKGGRA
jgi:hypothetical protein